MQHRCREGTKKDWNRGTKVGKEEWKLKENDRITKRSDEIKTKNKQ
jgi:hypothetical protein